MKKKEVQFISDTFFCIRRRQKILKLSSFRDFSFVTLVESDRREMAVVGEKEKVICVCVCMCVCGLDENGHTYSDRDFLFVR